MPVRIPGDGGGREIKRMIIINRPTSREQFILIRDMMFSQQ
jgi:hypothetical protein